MNQEAAISRRVRVMLKCQEALLKAITPNIREVLVDWSEQDITIRFVYDGQYSKEDIREAERVTAKMQLYFPEDHVQSQCIRVDFPAPLGLLGQQAIYVRKEIYTA